MNNIDKVSPIGGTTRTAFSFHTFRNISTESDKELKRQIFVGQANISELVNIPEFGNVRRYLKKNKKGEKTATSGVHKEIMTSLENSPENFNFLNGGITITCSGLEQRGDIKQISLTNATIINGSQTKGVCEAFLKANPNKDAICAFQILVILPNGKVNDGLSDDVAIARNQQNKVKALSIAGKLGILDEINSKVDVELQTDESQSEFYDTMKFLQLLFLILPVDIWEENFKKIKCNKAAIYSSKAKWLTQFEFIHSDQHKNDSSAILYSFFLDIAQQVLDLYQELQNADFLKGTHKQIREGYKIDKDGKYTIQDGWLFPIIAALSHYVVKNKGKYTIQIPKDFNYKGLVALIYKNGRYADNPNVQLLGKNESSYDTPAELLEESQDIPAMLKKNEIKIFK